MGWSDYADFSSVDKLRLTTPLDGILPLIKAVNERCAVAGISTITEPARLDAIAALSVIQSEVTALIPLFVNQKTSGGVYTGLSEIPVWTENDILTSIGANSRIAAPASIYELSADWLYQQYLILNKLVWFKSESGSIINNDNCQGGGDGESLQSAVDDAINTKFGLAPLRHLIQNFTSAYYRGPDSYPFNPPWAGFVKAQPGKIRFTTSDSYYCSVSVYFLAGLAETNVRSWEINSFNGGGIAVEGLNFVEDIAANNNHNYTSELIGSASIFPKYPTPPSVGEWSVFGWECTRLRFIKKFNVTGGFEFI